MALKIAILMGLFFLASCASEPKKTGPAWLDEPARTVDNGYIVYIGKSEGFTTEKAQFRAEGVALQDLANECSFVPKGTRTEDRYVQEGERKVFTAWVRVAIEFKDCDEAQKTTDPEKIRDKASLAFMEELKKYQDVEETGEVVDTKPGDVAPDVEGTPVPVQASGVNEQTHFFVMRQYIAYQKQVVIFAPSTAYAPGSPEAVHFGNAMQMATPVVTGYTVNHPEIFKSPAVWSRLPDHPAISRPATLGAGAQAVHQQYQSLPKPPRNPNRSAPKVPGKKRRRPRHEH